MVALKFWIKKVTNREARNLRIPLLLNSSFKTSHHSVEVLKRKGVVVLREDRNSIQDIMQEVIGSKAKDSIAIPNPLSLVC